MKTSIVLPGSVAVVGLLMLAVWPLISGSRRLEARVPGLDGTTVAEVSADYLPPVAGDPTTGPGTPSAIAGQWPQFRGIRRDGICDDGTVLTDRWPAGGPPILWQLEMGEGYASAVIRDGCAYVLDYDVDAKADTLLCLSVDDGREIWRNSYPAMVVRNHGMSRTTPAMAGDRIVTIGPRCHVACWDTKTGACHWLIDMVHQFGSEERQWYTGQCPLIDGGYVILAPCGQDALLVALDLETGEIVWQTPNARNWKMSHGSIMPMELAGRRMYAYCGTGGTVGVSAEDGAVLWDETNWIEHFATSPSPLPLPDGRVFLCSGYDIVGAMMLQVTETDERFTAETAFTMKRKQYNSEQQTPLFFQGHIYAVRKLREQLVCMDLDGNELWNSGPQKFGHGPYLIADGKIIVLSGDGLLAMAEATPDAYQPLGEFQVFEDGHDAWGPMAIASGRLICRDMTRMACLNLSE